MSQVKLNTKWQHQEVLPYILDGLRQKIETITPVLHIYLYGSRAKTPMDQWDKLQGKDWDIVVICAFPIKNTAIWTSDLNYHIDLVVTNAEGFQSFIDHKIPTIALFPNNELNLDTAKIAPYNVEALDNPNNLDDFDLESQEMLRGLKLFNLDEITNQQKNQQNALNDVRTTKNFEEISNEYAMRSPFGENSIFAKPKPGDFYEDYVKFIEVLYKIGAAMPEKDQVSSGGTNLEEVVVQSKTDESIFDYKKYTIENQSSQNYWNYWDNNFTGQAILNKKIAYLDQEKVFLIEQGSYAQFSLYIPYKNDSNVSLNNFSSDYLENQSAVKINFLDFDGLFNILNNLYRSKRKQYVEKIYKEIAKKYDSFASQSNGLFFINDAPLELLQYFSNETLKTIFFRLLNDILNDDKEIVVLKLLAVFSMKKDFNADVFLTSLLTEKVNGTTALQALYSKMNDWGGENNFSKTIIELTKIWLLSSYCDPNNKAYSGYEPTTPLAYQQKIILGFRSDNFIFEFDNNNDVLISDSPISGIPVPGLTRYTKYHPFQPIITIDVEEAENEDLKLENNVAVPAFYLKAFDDKGAWENFEKTVWLVFDVLSLVSGIGNLAKLRYFIETEKLAVVVLKTVFGVIQVASPVLSIGLTLVENSKNRELVNKMRQYLFWVEICTLSADVLSSKILSKKAKEAQEALNVYRETIKNEEILDELDEFAEHLDEVIESERKLINEWDNGKILSERTLRKRIKNLIQEYKNFKLEVSFLDDIKDADRIADWNARNVLGSFAMGPPPKLYFRKQVTELTWQHEIWHLEDLKKMGSKLFYNTPNWKKEELVWERIWKTKGRWTEEELVDSYYYYKETMRKEVGSANKVKELEDLLEKPFYKRRYNK
jgi:hypothetical protein